MPGELQDEYDGPYVGRYEKRYVQSPGWDVDPGYGNLPGRPELDEKGQKIYNTMLNMVGKHVEERDSDKIWQT